MFCSKALRTAITVATGLVLGGCDQKPAENAGEITVTFWHYFSEAQSKPLKELLPQFEAQNPGIKVKALFQGNPHDLKQKLDGSFAVNPANNPTVSTLYESWTDDFVNRGFIDPVEGHLSGPEGMTPEQRDDIVKVFREGNTWNGKLMTLPFNKSIYMLYVNSDKLAAAGMTTAPQTQDDFVQAVSKCTVAQNGSVQTYGFGMQPRSEAFTTLFYARGGDFVKTDGTPNFDSPEALQVLTMLRSLQFPEKHLYVNADYMSDPFGNGQIAMYSYSSASFPYNKKVSAGRFKYEAAPVPGVPGTNARYLMQGTNLGIFADRPEAERRAAWKLLKFLTEAKNSAVFASQAGYMPIRYSELKEPVMQKYIQENPDYALAASLVLTDKGKQEPKFAAWEGIRNDIDALIDNALSRADVDPKAALAQLQAKSAERMKKK